MKPNPMRAFPSLIALGTIFLNVAARATGPDPLPEALPILQSAYVDFSALQPKEGDRLSDLISRSAGRISLVTPDPAPQATPVLTAALPENIAYWRLASFSPKAPGTDLLSDLRQSALSATALVVDLRSTTTPDDYKGAAQILQLIAPEDTTLNAFTPSTSPLTPAIQMPLVVLTNAGTTGAGEVLAACLKARGAIIIGRATAGRVAVFSEQKLASGEVLRYVSGAIPTSEEIPLWGKPVLPDVALKVNDRTEKATLMLIRNNHIADVIGESAKRARMNEAALVQGQDPEWDAYLKSLQTADDHYQSLPPMRDTALIHALDCLKAIRLLPKPAPTPARIVSLPPAPTKVQ